MQMRDPKVLVVGRRSWDIHRLSAEVGRARSGDFVRASALQKRIRSGPNGRREHSEEQVVSIQVLMDGLWVNAMVRLFMCGLLSALASVIIEPACAGDSNAGMASYYAGISASAGELTAAHRSLSFGTRVRVISVRSGRSVVVRINDRGPFINGRIIDLSRPAAVRLNMLSTGVTQVRLEIVGRPTNKTQSFRRHLGNSKNYGSRYTGRRRNAHHSIELDGV
jgi:rare lipoprotein A